MSRVLDTPYGVSGAEPQMEALKRGGVWGGVEGGVSAGSIRLKHLHEPLFFKLRAEAVACA